MITGESVPIHVVPRGDLREHVCEGLTCWCRPELDDDGVITHHAMDQRESYENGRKPS